jgi:hypothetical protein
LEAIHVPAFHFSNVLFADLRLGGELLVEGEQQLGVRLDQGIVVLVDDLVGGGEGLLRPLRRVFAQVPLGLAQAARIARMAARSFLGLSLSI